jgi:hypothetical protein
MRPCLGSRSEALIVPKGPDSGGVKGRVLGYRCQSVATSPSIAIEMRFLCFKRL